MANNKYTLSTVTNSNNLPMYMLIFLLIGSLFQVTSITETGTTNQFIPYIVLTDTFSRQIFNITYTDISMNGIRLKKSLSTCMYIFSYYKTLLDSCPLNYLIHSLVILGAISQSKILWIIRTVLILQIKLIYYKHCPFTSSMRLNYK